MPGGCRGSPGVRAWPSAANGSMSDCIPGRIHRQVLLVDCDGNPIDGGNPLPTSGGGGGGGAVTIADGADVNAGATTDAAVTTDVNATESSKLRGLVKILADVWDSVNQRLRVAVTAALPTGDNAIGRVKITDGTDVATVRDLTNSDPLDVAIVDGSGNQITSFGGSSSATATRSSVSGSTSAVTILASNTSRKGATVYNDSTALLYLGLGSSVTTTDFTVPMPPRDYYEVPSGYTGIITGIWAFATGNARVTELT